MVGATSETLAVCDPCSACCRHQSFPLKQPVGCIALTEDPNIILAALEREVVTINLKTQTQER